MGNAVGIVSYSLSQGYDTTVLTVGVPSYREIEGPFDHIWSWADGCKYRIQPETDGGLSESHTYEGPQYFQDTGCNSYELRGVLPHKEGYIREIIIGEHSEFIPFTVGVGSATCLLDHFYTNISAPSEAQRGMLFGSSPIYSTYTGVGRSFTHNTMSSTYTSVGSRLCFLLGVQRPESFFEF